MLNHLIQRVHISELLMVPCMEDFDREREMLTVPCMEDFKRG